MAKWWSDVGGPTLRDGTASMAGPRSHAPTAQHLPKSAKTTPAAKPTRPREYPPRCAGVFLPCGVTLQGKKNFATGRKTFLRKAKEERRRARAERRKAKKLCRREHRHHERRPA